MHDSRVGVARPIGNDGARDGGEFSLLVPSHTKSPDQRQPPSRDKHQGGEFNLSLRSTNGKVKQIIREKAKLKKKIGLADPVLTD